MSDRIQMRRGTKQQWETANPVLADGEAGLERIDGACAGFKQKIGNGVTAWNDLPYHAIGDSVGNTAGSFYHGDVIGVCLDIPGGGVGHWTHVDGEGNNVLLGKSYFDNHPVYSKIKTGLVDGQYMVGFPAFYIKNFRPASGPNAGRQCWLISPTARAGFRLHPAFMKNGSPIAVVYIASYVSCCESDKLWSLPGMTPSKNTFAQLSVLCNNKNTGGVTGFALWDLYQRSITQWLFLVEFASTDSKALFPNMGSGTYSDMGGSWRGLYALWGLNIYIDGIMFRNVFDTDPYIQIFSSDGSRSYVQTPMRCLMMQKNTDCIVRLSACSGSLYNLNDCFFPEPAMNLNTEEASFPDLFTINGLAASSNDNATVAAHTTDGPFGYSLSYSVYESGGSSALLHSRLSKT